VLTFRRDERDTRALCDVGAAVVNKAVSLPTVTRVHDTSHLGADPASQHHHQHHDHEQHELQLTASHADDWHRDDAAANRRQ